MDTQTINSTLKRNPKKDILITVACYLIPLVSIGSYFFSVVSRNAIPPADGYYLIHYLYTYDHGFVPRGLVGEIISLFYDTVSDELTQKVVILFSFLLMLFASLCIGKALSSVKNNPKFFCFVAVTCTLLSIAPATFQYYFTDLKLDKILWAITFLAVLLADRKYGIWLVPILCVTATLINPVFLFSSMILISIILLQEFYSNGFSVKNGIICAVSYLSMIAIGIYSPISEKFLGFETPQEMIDFYFARYSGPIDKEAYELFATEWLFDYFDPLNVVLEKSFKYYFVAWGNGIMCALDLIFLMIPVYTLTGLFWKSCIKSTENKMQKFIFFLCMISPVVTIPPIILSWESSKYFYNNLIVQLALMIYFVVKNNPAFVCALDKAIAFVKKHAIASVFFFIYFIALLFA